MEKGEVVANRDQLFKAFRRIGAIGQRSLNWTANHANSQEFFLQQFVDVFPKGVVSVTGFMDRSGRHFPRGCTAQITPCALEPAGVGVCFESTPLDPALAELTALVPQPRLFRCF